METTKCKQLRNPRDSAKIFSALFFTWTSSIFKKGFQKRLDITDICEPLNSDQSESLGDRLDKYGKIGFFLF